MAIYWLLNYEEPNTKQNQMAEVFYKVEYRLEDNTWIGIDESDWVGNGFWSGLAEGAALTAGTGVGQWIGWQFGSYFGAWVGAQVGIGAGYSTYALGLGALAAGPWVGAIVGGTLGFM